LEVLVFDGLVVVGYCQNRDFVFERFLDQVIFVYVKGVVCRFDVLAILVLFGLFPVIRLRLHRQKVEQQLRLNDHNGLVSMLQGQIMSLQLTEHSTGVEVSFGLDACSDLLSRYLFLFLIILFDSSDTLVLGEASKGEDEL